jgi:hypothetical protein
MMMTEMDIETSVYYVHLTRLIAREDFIKFTRRESTKTCNILFMLLHSIQYCNFLGSTAQLRPWLPPQNQAEFLGGFSTIFFLQVRVVSPTPNPHPGGPGLYIYIPQRQGGYPF